MGNVAAIHERAPSMPIARSTAEYVEILQGLDEEKLTKRVVMPLLAALAFNGVRYVHGRLERGKDLVFWKVDVFGEKEWYAAQVKAGKTSAATSDSSSLRTLINQLQQAYDSPFTDVDGTDVLVSKCFFITSAIISTDARESIKGLLREVRVFRPVKIIDGPDLVDLVRRHCPGVLMSWEDNLSSYCKVLEKAFRPYLDYKALGLENQPILEDFYVDVSVSLKTDTIYVAPPSYEISQRVIEVSQEPNLRQLQKELKSACNLEIQFSDVFQKESPDSHGQPATPRTKEPRANASVDKGGPIRIGILLNCTALGKYFADLIFRIESLQGKQAPINIRTSDSEMSLVVNLLTIFKVIRPYIRLLESFISFRPLRSFIPFSLHYRADPFFVFQKSKRNWILGQAGTGKSTLCRYYTMMLARSMDFEKEGARVPVIIALSSYDAKAKSLIEVILRSLAQYGVNIESMPHEKLLEEGSFIVLLDGLDELPGDDARKVFLAHLSEFQKSFPENHVVITSRYIKPPLELNSFIQYHTLLFDDPQILAFCEKWFAQDTEKRIALRRLIETNETFRVIARNPLCLTLIAALVQNGRPIPQRRSEVYKERLDLLLQRWDYSRGVHRNRYEAELKLRILKRLALDLHSKQRRDFAFKDFYITASQSAPSPFNDEQTIKDIFEELIINNALIQQVDSETYDFGHLSFQEYFVAREIVEARDITFLKDHYLKDWWRQVTLLCGGIVRAGDEIIQDLFDAHQETITQDDRVIHLAAEIASEADWTSQRLVMSIGSALVDRCRRRKNLEEIAVLLSMKRREAYRIFFDSLQAFPNALSNPSIQGCISEAAGGVFYEELLASISHLSREVRQYFVSFMDRRGTELDTHYLQLLETRSQQPSE